MFKKQAMTFFFIIACSVYQTEATLYKQTVTFSGCDAQTILTASTLQEVINLLVEQLDQQEAGATSVHYTDAGYTLLQALQSGGYISVSIENPAKTAYIDLLIQKSTTQKESIAAIFKKVKSKLGSS